MCDEDYPFRRNAIKRSKTLEVAGKIRVRMSYKESGTAIKCHIMIDCHRLS